jgi:hypothetical protein
MFTTKHCARTVLIAVFMTAVFAVAGTISCETAHKQRRFADDIANCVSKLPSSWDGRDRYGHCVAAVTNIRQLRPGQP